MTHTTNITGEWCSSNILWITHLVLCKYVANIFSSSHALYEPKMTSVTVTKADKKDAQKRTKANYHKINDWEIPRKIIGWLLHSINNKFITTILFLCFQLLKAKHLLQQKKWSIATIYTVNDPDIIRTYLVRPQYDIVSASKFLLDNELRWLS